MGKDPGPGQVHSNLGLLKVTHPTREGAVTELDHYTMSSTTDKETSNRQNLSPKD